MRTNKPNIAPRTHEGAVANWIKPHQELRRTLMNCMLFENTFYEGGDSIAQRIADLIPQVAPQIVCEMALEARSSMQLRHAPLFVVRELARIKGTGPLIAEYLPRIVQRADELSEFLALYWRDGRQPVAAGVKRGLAAAFPKFSAYQLAKYNRDGKVKLRDALFVCHAKPKDAEQAEVWRKLVDKTLEPPDTWEVALSAGADKKETFERLLREEKLGGLAVLRNLRNMQTAGVDDNLIRQRLSAGISRALPFRFVTAARYAPTLEPDIESAMLKGLEDFPQLAGITGLLVDVSGSMDWFLSDKSETTRMDAASGLAIMLREIAERVEVATFSSGTKLVPPRRGFALRDAIDASQPHSSTLLAKSLKALRDTWADVTRMIVITDEQSHDGSIPAWTPHAYVINVAPYQHGISYTGGWTHIDGWSERVIDYIRLIEQEQVNEDTKKS